MWPETPSFSDFYHPSLNIHHLRDWLNLKESWKQYLIRIVLVSEVSSKFSFVTFNMAPLLGLSFSFSDLIYSALSRSLFFHKILTNIPSSMTFTIFLSISRFVSIFVFVLFCKQSFKTVIKISSHPEHVHTSLPPCWLPLPFDSRLQRSQLTSLTYDYH